MILKPAKSIKIIAAVSDNDVIGLENGSLPWILPSDLKHFKELTIGNTVVMGYNTWKSLGEKPLANRVNLILSRKKRPLPRKREVRQIHNPMQIFGLPKGWQQGDIWIIGGGKVYETYLPMATELYLTFVHVRIPFGEKQIKFPHVDWSEWAETEESKKSEELTNGKIHFEFKHYVRSTL